MAFNSIKTDNDGNVTIATPSTYKPVVTNATGSAAINTTTAISEHMQLVEVTCHFSAAPTTSENFIVTLDACDGAGYDTVLCKTDPSASAATDIVFIPDCTLLLEDGDEIKVTYTNTDTRTYGLRIVTRMV